MADLESRVRAVVMSDASGVEGLYNSPAGAPDEGETATRAMDWGWIYGLAYAIARAEDPFEPIPDVEGRANAAARPVFAEYVGVGAAA